MENENDLFYFESDHVALKSNKDYCELLKTIVVLEAQKVQAVKDIEKLIEIQNVAIKDPVDFIEKLKNNVDVGFPFRQNIPEIPSINWSKYGVPVPEEALKLIKEGGSKNETIKSLQRDKNFSTQNQNPRHNQAWTPEEQKKLEELLIKYPPEAVEMRRFKKIANELGNRTVLQVSSRVQKYFLKLHKAGLPIPGRIPKTIERKRVHKLKKHNYLLYKPTTFFPDYNVPFYMPDDDEEDSVNENSQPVQNDSQPIKNQLSLKIELLRKIKIETTKAKNLPSAIHTAYKCDLCGEDPLRGIRWHCITCYENSIDFCNDCIISQLNGNNPHSLHHEFVCYNQPELPIKEEISQSEPGSSNIVNFANIDSITSTLDIKQEAPSENESSSEESDSLSYSNYNSEDNVKDFDQDYLADMFPNDKKYNYLDPNFLPELHKNEQNQ